MLGNDLVQGRLPTVGMGVIGIWWVETRDATQHSTRHPEAPHKSCLVPKDNPEVEKPCLKPCLLSPFKQNGDS